MNIQEYIERIRQEVWEATKDTGGPSNGLHLTVHLDEHAQVIKEQEKACTVEISQFYSDAWLLKARQSEARSEHEK